MSKKLGKYRLVNTAIYINKVTIRDTNILLNTDEFVEEFSRIAIASLVNLFSSYNQIRLDARNRDITTI